MERPDAAETQTGNRRIGKWDRQTDNRRYIRMCRRTYAEVNEVKRRMDGRLRKTRAGQMREKNSSMSCGGARE